MVTVPLLLYRTFTVPHSPICYLNGTMHLGEEGCGLGRLWQTGSLQRSCFLCLDRRNSLNQGGRGTKVEVGGAEGVHTGLGMKQ
jgi:hypothetical protein